MGRHTVELTSELQYGDKAGITGKEGLMYEAPVVIASFDAGELLAEVHGGNPGCGNEGNDQPVGNGSCHSVV